MFERFWDAVGGAQNLEGICILTCCSLYINNRVIIKNVQNASIYNVYHFILVIIYLNKGTYVVLVAVWIFNLGIPFGSGF